MVLLSPPQVRSVLLDEVMKDPENPTDDMISDMDIKVHPSASVVVGGLVVTGAHERGAHKLLVHIMDVSIAFGFSKHKYLRRSS